jgi:hypothetical protein
MEDELMKPQNKKATDSKSGAFEIFPLKKSKL